MRYMYILEINPLLVVSLSTIVSHSDSCLLMFIVSFVVQKLLSLIRYHLFLFVLIYVTPRGGS